MKKKLNLFILIFFIILLIGCSKNNESLKNTEENSTFIIMDYENYNSDGYKINEFCIKRENEKVSKISNDPWLDFGFVYSNEEEYFLYVDYSGNLQMISKNNFKRIIGKNVAIKEDNKYNSDFGCVERFSYFLIPSSKNIEKSFGTSKNGKTIGYIDSELNFFISKNKNSRKHIDNNVTSFTIDYFGENIYYIKSSNELYLYKNGKSQKITDNVKNFLISKDGNNIAWIDNKHDIYVENISTNDKYKLCNYKKGTYVILCDDNSILYTKVIHNESKDLYRYSNSKSKKIASNIIGFSQYKNIIYYIDKENNLFEMDIKANYKKNKIKSNIKKFVLSDSKIYFLDYNNDIYKKENDKKIEKIASDVSEDYIIIDDNVVYKKDNSIYINTEKIAEKIKAFSFNSSYIAYVDAKDQVHVYNVKNKEDSIQIKDVKKHSRIYFGNNFLYQTNLAVDNIEGYYCAEEDFFIDNKRGKLVELKKNNEVIFFFDDNTKKEYFYEEEDGDGYISDEIFFRIKNKSLKIKLYYTLSSGALSEEVCDLRKISRDEFYKKLDEIRLVNEKN